MLVVPVPSGEIISLVFKCAIRIFEYKSPGQRNVFRGFYYWELIHWSVGFEKVGTRKTVAPSAFKYMQGVVSIKGIERFD